MMPCGCRGRCARLRLSSAAKDRNDGVSNGRSCYNLYEFSAFHKDMVDVRLKMVNRCSLERPSVNGLVLGLELYEGKLRGSLMLRKGSSWWHAASCARKAGIEISETTEGAA